jgi:hypothetical protein
MDLFKECLPSILEKNEYLIKTGDDEKSYSPYTVNKALSVHIDCLLHANAMNMYHSLDKKMQYDYLFYSVRKYKRKYQKWIKFNETKDIQLIKEYYNCSLSKAKDYLTILTKDQLKEIESKLDKGGKY